MLKSSAIYVLTQQMQLCTLLMRAQGHSALRAKLLIFQVLCVQAAYENADSAAMALQAVAPVGLKHFQTSKLVLKEQNLLVQTQEQSS